MRLVFGLSILFFLFLTKDTYSQVYGNYFFGENYKKYLGLKVKLDIENGSSHLETLVFSSVPNSASDYDKLEADISGYKNTVFVIDSIFEFSYEPENKLLKVFRLKDNLGKKNLYYNYNSTIREFHYLLSEFGKGGYDSKYDNLIERTVDDFDTYVTSKGFVFEGADNEDQTEGVSYALNLNISNSKASKFIGLYERHYDDKYYIHFQTLDKNEVLISLTGYTFLPRI
jgi:hypothetical protein